MERKNFGWPVPMNVNHGFGPEHFNAYSLLSAKTACGLKFVGLHHEETMTSGASVTCLRCLAISAGLSAR